MGHIPRGGRAHKHAEGAARLKRTGPRRGPVSFRYWRLKMARSRSKKIDTLRWIGFRSGAAGLSAGTVAANLLSASTFPDTIMRTRGNLIAYLDGAGAPGETIDVGVGFIIVPEGTSTTVLWSPISDPNAPWFWYERFVLGHEELVVDVVDIPGISSFRSVIDSKAMRRGPPDTEVQLVIEQGTIESAGSINLQVSGRILVGQ